MVAAARRVLGERRIGHCGTLDPMATGVLALAVGPRHAAGAVPVGGPEAVRRGGPFGRETDTYDATGEVVAESAERPSRGRLRAALAQFLRPFPTGAAGLLREEDRRRAGICPRAPEGRRDAPSSNRSTVRCHDLTLTAFDGERAWLTMTVSAGFYVRSLAHDLGRALGLGGRAGRAATHAGGPFGWRQAVTFERLVRASRGELLAEI